MLPASPFLASLLLWATCAYADDYPPSLQWEHSGLDTQGQPETIRTWRATIKHQSGAVVETQDKADPDGSLRAWQMDPIAISEPGQGSAVVSGTMPSTYLWSKLAVGEVVYIDRAYQYTAVPAAYSGFDVLRTANNDKTQAGDVVQFELSQSADIYVAHDARVTTKPAWLSGWTATGDVLQTQDATLEIFQTTAAAGTVTLGQNHTTAGSSMYVVLADLSLGGSLVYGTTYDAELQALDAAGNISDPAQATLRVTKSTKPTAPQQVIINIACPQTPVPIECIVFINGFEQ